MKISTTALWHNKKILAWLPKFGTTQSSVWVEWGAWLLEIVVRRRTPHALDGARLSLIERDWDNPEDDEAWAYLSKPPRK